MKEHIRSLLPTECPWGDTLYWYDSIGSTNTAAKEMARSGAPHGTVLIAGQQTLGRGRLGRSFHSPAGKGLYLSVILRPECQPAQLMHLTCAVAVAVCNAIEETTGYRPGIKWINDLVADQKKLGGILTELSIDPKTGLVQFAVIGIGINCSHTPADFPPEIRQIATSLDSVTGAVLRRENLAAAVIKHLWKTDAQLLPRKAAIMQRYREDCITLGNRIVLLRGEEKRYGLAKTVEEDGSLLVHFDDGTAESVSSGEVSVRGMYGYT